jgi:hypothetical protein
MLKHAEVVNIVSRERRASLKDPGVFYREFLLLFFRLRFELGIVRKFLFIELLILASEIYVCVFEQLLSGTFIQRRAGLHVWSKALRKGRHCGQKY